MEIEMADFGSGGFGGLGASYPMRYGAAPQSQQVLSDQEFNTPKRTEVQLLPGATGYDQNAASPYIGDILNTMAMSQWTKSGLDPSDPGFATWKAAALTDPNSALSAWNTAGDPSSAYGAGTTAAANGASQTVAQFNPVDPNAIRQRGENQMAQQQAYNGMMGNGQLNGIIGQNYTDQNFGQVTGQQTPSLQSQLDQVPGLDTTGLAGIYSPTGTYNPMSSTKRVWGLG
jgi:hypothetical protein